jgi:hypothetical protein
LAQEVEEEPVMKVQPETANEEQVARSKVGIMNIFFIGLIMIHRKDIVNLCNPIIGEFVKRLDFLT